MFAFFFLSLEADPGGRPQRLTLEAGVGGTPLAVTQEDFLVLKQVVGKKTLLIPCFHTFFYFHVVFSKERIYFFSISFFIIFVLSFIMSGFLTRMNINIFSNFSSPSERVM